jgi:flagellar basal-body rod protein FlgF
MNRGIYSVVNGMLASQQALDVVSNNLANSNTTGFKADQVVFNEELERQLSTSANSSIGGLGTGPTAKSQFTDFEQGSITNSGNSLDLALEGPGMFAVQDSKGQISYTRNGAFSQDPTGKLITKDGKSVLSASLKPIQLLPGTFNIDASGAISSPNGTSAYATIGIFNGTFAKSPSGAYQSKDVAAQSGPAIAKVKQGSLEASNVNPISSMVQMISYQRSFDMAQKSILAEDDMTQKLSTILS